jgi:phosphatidylglycerophosphatase A
VKDVKQRVAYVLAIWFGCGLVPIAPGTAGTLGAVPLYLLLRPHGPIVVLAAATILAAVGIWAAAQVIATSGEKDPQIVVIDEVAGVLVTLAACVPTWTSLVVGVIAFRIFDQFKPWPARDFERRLPGGWGVVMDDIAAGAWGAGAVVALRALGLGV